MDERSSKQLVSLLTPSQIAKAKDAIDLLSSLTSPSATTQPQSSVGGPSDTGPSRTAAPLKRADPEYDEGNYKKLLFLILVE